MDLKNYHIFLQARLGSKRLPEKVLMQISGKTIIEHIIDRLKKLNVDIILVTGPKEKNHLLIEKIKHLDIEWFLGSEENLLDRYYKASSKFKTKNIIRVTADCPLIDIDLINKGMKIFEEGQFDILSLGRKKSFPHGMNFQIFKKSALEKTWNKIKSEYTKKEFEEKFIPVDEYMLNNENFLKYDLVNDEDLSYIRLTLDYIEDFKLISNIYQELSKESPFFGLKEIIEFLRKNEKLLEINQKYIKN